MVERCAFKGNTVIGEADLEKGNESLFLDGRKLDARQATGEV